MIQLYSFSLSPEGIHRPNVQHSKICFKKQLSRQRLSPLNLHVSLISYNICSHIRAKAPAEDGEYFQRPESKTRIDSGSEECRTEPI